MKKRVLILDLDGTLYYQLGVQFIMGCQLIFYYIFHFWKLKELMIIISYRKIRENNIKGIIDKQYILISKKYNTSVNKVKKIIEKWMFVKPLNILPLFRDKKLLTIVENFKLLGGKIIIYSDYPTKDKLKVLNVNYDKSYDSTHSQIRTLKPDPKGIEYIIKENKLKKNEILYIGDRESKDGECARKCNIDYIILPKYFRNKKYSMINEEIGVN